ncbi:MAG: ATP-binding protein [Candidatus Muiribacteriota bacterium]
MNDFIIVKDMDKIPELDLSCKIENIDNFSIDDKTDKKVIFLLQNIENIQKFKPVRIINRYPFVFTGIKQLKPGLMPDFKLNDISADFFNSIQNYFTNREKIIYELNVKIFKSPFFIRQCLDKIIKYLSGIISESELIYYKLVLDEALLNAYRHGNKFDNKKVIKVRIHYYGYKIELKVEDEGQGFNVSSIKTINELDVFSATGRGLHLIKEIMDEVDFRYRGNIINMVKYLKAGRV